MRRIGYLAGGSVLAITLSLGLASAAAAQEPAEVEAVIVTGSLIAGTPEDAALPVDVISQEDLQRQGSPTTVELLKSLSVSSGVLGDTNQFDPRAQGSEGSGSVNLRGLGAQRTLVLLNGRRMPINPFGQAGAGIVDTNMIPQAAIGRVEILKDGAAATYGSDAIGGVVNFITRKNFEGLEVSGSYRVIDGSDGDWTTSAAYGWTNEKVSVLLTAGFQHRSKLPTTERSWANRDYLENPEGGWSAGNSVAPMLPTFSPAPGVFAPAAGFTLDRGCTPLGGVILPGALPACALHYIPYDNIVEKEDRYQLYGEVNADLTDTTKFHFDVLYGYTDVPEWNTSPSYLALQTSTAATNPAAGLPGAVLKGFFVPGANPGLALYRTQNPGQIPAFANGVHIPGVRYRPFGVGGNPAFGYGPSVGERTYEEVRYSASLSGTFDNDVNWDFGITYGSETGYRSGYDTVVSRFQMALRGYGQLDGEGGCTAAQTANYTTNAGNAAIGCHWFNPFSNGVESNSITGQTNPNFSATVLNDPDLVRWFFQKTETEQKSSLAVVDFVLTGKTPIVLGGGNVAWAAAAQFRKSYFESSYNDLSNLDITPCIDTPFNGSTSCSVSNGPFMFLGGGYEADMNTQAHAFAGELSLPFTDDFQVQVAARFESYGAVGDTFDPKISARWQITDWIALRGSAGSTFRAPPQTQLAAGSVTALSFIGGAFRAIDIFGNADLEPESANTYSLGVIFDVGGLKATIDWWKFEFENPIVAEPSASIVNTMFPTAPGTPPTTDPLHPCNDPAFAGLKSRFTFQGACSTTTIARVRTGWVNGPAVETSGFDFLIDYDFGEVFGGDLRVGSSITYTSDYKVAPFIVEGVQVEAAFDAVGFLNYQLGPTSLPQWKGNGFLEYTKGAHNLRFTVNYIDEYTDQRTAPFTTPIVVGDPLTGAPLPAVTVPGGKTIDRYVTYDLDYRVLLPWDTTLVASIDNLFDEDPSFARLDLNYDPFTGSALGRTFKFSLTKKF
ncbi:MAG: TonB-dependent receptor [Pseudomonadota bacterium]